MVLRLGRDARAAEQRWHAVQLAAKIKGRNGYTVPTWMDRTLAGANHPGVEVEPVGSLQVPTDDRRFPTTFSAAPRPVKCQMVCRKGGLPVRGDAKTWGL